MIILIADDEDIVRTSLDGILKKGGNFETDFAVDGLETIEKAAIIHYDMILLDINMPKLDGYAVLEKVRARYPDLPIAFITGRGKPEKVAESIAKDKLNAFIEKPFTPEQVLAVVKKLLKQ